MKNKKVALFSLLLLLQQQTHCIKAPTLFVLLTAPLASLYAYWHASFGKKNNAPLETPTIIANNPIEEPQTPPAIFIQEKPRPIDLAEECNIARDNLYAVEKKFEKILAKTPVKDLKAKIDFITYINDKLAKTKSPIEAQTERLRVLKNLTQCLETSMDPGSSMDYGYVSEESLIGCYKNAIAELQKSE